MARIANTDLKANKRIDIALSYIFGVGRSSALKIVDKVGIDGDKKVKDLTDDEINKIRKEIELEYKVEGELRTEIKMNIKRLIDIKSYRGVRHRRGLPVRGQRSKTNARTRKGSKGNVRRK